MRERMAFRCEWRSGQVFFYQRKLKDAEALPAGWHGTEEKARESVASEIKRIAYDMLRAADEVTRDRRGE